MNTTLKSKDEIIDEIAAAYNINTRAINNHGTCLYETEDGKNCAVGRCIDPSKIDRKTVVGIITNLDDPLNLEDVLHDEYKGHDLDFWRDLQILHDDVLNWNEDGLSELGKHFVKELKEKWA